MLRFGIIFVWALVALVCREPDQVSGSASSPMRRHNPYSCSLQPWDLVVRQLQGGVLNEVVEKVLELKVGDVRQESFDKYASLWLRPYEDFVVLPLPLGIRLTDDFREQYEVIVDALNKKAGERSGDKVQQICFYKILIRYADVMTDEENFKSLSEKNQKLMHARYFDYRLGLGNILSCLASSCQGHDREHYNREAFDVFYNTLNAALNDNEKHTAGKCYLIMSRIFVFLGENNKSYCATLMDACMSKMDAGCFDSGYRSFDHFIRRQDRAKICGGKH